MAIRNFAPPPISAPGKISHPPIPGPGKVGPYGSPFRPAAPAAAAPAAAAPAAAAPAAAAPAAAAPAAAPAPAASGNHVAPKRSVDLPRFVAQLENQIDADRVKNATKMLKADRFQLFDEVADDHVSGVIHSQSTNWRIYACKIDKKGNFMCCTQNLAHCGGLRGQPCKHLFVLMIGLVQAGKIDAAKLSEWTKATKGKKPALDKTAMSATFVKYKGAEAGEIEWRPTETTPEDYYAL